MVKCCKLDFHVYLLGAGFLRKRLTVRGSDFAYSVSTFTSDTIFSKNGFLNITERTSNTLISSQLQIYTF